MHAAGVQTSVHYPAAHKFSTYKDLGAVLPQTEYVTDNEVTLPMYAALTPEQIDFICDTFEKAVKDLVGKALLEASGLGFGLHQITPIFVTP